MISIPVTHDRRVRWQQTRLTVSSAVLTAALPVDRVRGVKLPLFIQHS